MRIKKKGNDGTDSVTGSGSGTGSEAESSDGQAKAKSSSSRIISENDPYYNVDAKTMQAAYDKSKEIEYSSIHSQNVVGERILAEVFVGYKKPDNVQAEQDKLNLDNDSQLERYMEIEAQYEERSLQLFDLNGESISKIVLEDNSTFTGAFPGKDGEILIVTSKMNPKECRAVPYVSVLSPSGEKLRDIDLQIKDELQDVRLYVLENGNMLLASIGKFWILDGSGKVLSTESNPDLNGTVLHSGGKWYAVMPRYTAEGAEMYVQEIDTDSGKLAGKAFKTIDAIFWMRQGDQDCFLLNANGIEKFDIATQTRTQVLAWKDTDINSSTLSLEGARIASENEMIFFQLDTFGSAGRASMDVKSKGAELTKVVHLTKADKNPHAGKTRMRLGINGDVLPEFIEKVLNYNKDPQNSTRIEMIDYTADSIDSMSESDYEKILQQSANQLVMDMLAGEGPDILVGYSDLSQFNSDTMLVDLNQLIQADSSFHREDYFDNLFRAFESDGKLYTIPLTYNLEGMAVNTAFNGAKENWTFAEFDQMASALSSNVQPLQSESPETLLKQWMQSLSSHFIDNQNKKVDFESEEFRKLLETVKKYGKCKPSGTANGPLAVTDGFTLNDDVYFMENMLACCYTSVSDLQAFASMTREKPDHKVVFTGIPTLSGMGMTVKGQLSMAITTSCEDQNLAWQFIRSFLDEDTQQELSFNSDFFPVNRNAFKKNCQTEIDVNNERMAEAKKNVSEGKINSEFLEGFIELNQQHTDSLEALISSVSSAQAWDNDVMNIVLEEAAGFFADQRTVDDVCKNIQNRASIVVQER